MNIKQFLPVILCAGLLSLAISSHAQDIDIYTGLNASTTIPNVIIVFDDAANGDASLTTPTSCPVNYYNSNTQDKVVGSEQCALATVIAGLATPTVVDPTTGNTSTTALLNIAIAGMNGVNFPLTPVDDKPYTGPSPVKSGSGSDAITITVPPQTNNMPTTNRQAIILAIGALQKVQGNANQGATFQEAWAYLTGGNSPSGASINTAVGLASQTPKNTVSYPTATFPATTASSGCQKNYLIFLSTATSSAHVNTLKPDEVNVLDAAARNALSNKNFGTDTSATNPDFLKLDPNAAGYTGTILVPTKTQSPYGLEWIRFMFNADANKTSTGTQNIISYSIGVLGTGTLTTDMEQYIAGVATYGGGKYFPAADTATLQSDITKIFNEVQAVNSVFASSSLPVSANAQGTFLNQIFMGMFRPDASGNPRWQGNLKQYQLFFDPNNNNNLELSDSVGTTSAINPTTGFISPNAISFWTCTNPACADPLPNGFWANDPSSTLAAAQGFDSPDGDRVERGGGAQHIRLINLNDNYKTTSGTGTTTRKLYTWCPSGSGCTTPQLLSDSPFTTSNASLTASLFGTLTTKMPGGATATSTDLINWVRGDDSVGDEASLCPPSSSGANGTAGSGNCPSTAVTTVRPSVHGDVLHSRPTVVDYGSYSITINSTTDSSGTRTATASAADVTTIGTFGTAPIVSFVNGKACAVTVRSATTFDYQSANCGPAGSQTAAVGAKIVVFYGDNGGVFHAVNGSQTATFPSQTATGPGEEIWGFIPKEFYGKLNRLMANSPQVLQPSTPTGITPTPQAKDYFIDGTSGLYQVVDGNGTTTTAVIYLSMRRGGNFIYALDVRTPDAPKVLWRVDSSSSGMGELGQTWSQPKVALVRGYCRGSTCSSNNPPSPVLIFGAGYDTNEDIEPPTNADTKGRGIFVLDALTGARVWSATSTSGSTSYSGGTSQASASIAGMNYSIPADITLVDRNFDGFIDRLYASDTGGNIWRVDLEPSGNATPDKWRVYQFAALGCGSGACGFPTNPTQRKFFYPPEVITATATHPYDSVITGSGDREHPLFVFTSSQRFNRIFLLKDIYTGNDATGMTPITLTGSSGLFDATSTSWDGTLNGYFKTLAAGEKIVNAPLAEAGFVFVGSNQPSVPSANSCNVNLGTAKGYRLSPFDGKLTSVVFNGGGLPPSPVAGIVDINVGGVIKKVPFMIGGGNPDCSTADCQSPLGGQQPVITPPTNRARTYRYIEGK